ncbi:MAG: M55 family metallopeptidase [Clostridia bacterium]|nr:M55 family metallopeptidase [Clostridia bacterium]
MYKKILLALDMEGVNNVVGTPYSGLSTDNEQYPVAIHQAALEINAAADALFNLGVESIDLWDNHGGGHNVIPAELDKRINLLEIDRSRPRMYFAENNKYDCICFFGYHAMEGTLGGVLAHTMNSKAIQYYKLNGRYIGEVDMDSYIAASHGLPSVFFAAGDIACSQAMRILPEIVTVATKKEISRNQAIFRDNEELFNDIREKIRNAVQLDMPIKKLTFPAVMEKSFKRVEDAEKYLIRLQKSNVSADYLDDAVLGKDAHTVVATVESIDEFIVCI